MSEAQNSENARRFSAEVWGEGNLALADQLIAPDLIDHTYAPSQHSGLEGHKQALASFRAAFPDFKVTVDDVIAEGDLTATLWHAEGTQKGDLMGIPATGKPIAVTGMDMLRFESGKIVERWAEINALAMMMQLGVIPTPGA